MEPQGSQPENLVLLYRNAVAQTVSHNSNSTALIQQLLYVDKPHAEKFAYLNFPDLVANNSQNSDCLKRLVMGLNILEKYGRHLLKPAESRSNMWRHIKFTNSIFRDRVDNIQGGRDIMALLGYSVVKEDGVAFPDGADPNHDQILNLVVDILLAKKEIEAYLTDTHPHKNHFDAYVCPQVPKIDMLEGAGRGEEVAEVQKQEYNQSSKPNISGLSETQSSFATATECKSAENEPEIRASSITCDICGKKQPDFVCEICDGKRLCRDCDITWHKHPKRQNHPRAPMGSIPLDESPPPISMNSMVLGVAYLVPSEGQQHMKPREPMSLYPSQTDQHLYANIGTSLPAMAKLNQSSNQLRLGVPQGCGEVSQPMPVTSQQWTGLHPGSSGSMPRLSGSPLGASGSLLSLTGSRMSSPDPLSSMAGGYQHSTSPVQTAAQVNVVNPLQFSQPGHMRFPATSDMQPSKGYVPGLTAGHNISSLQYTSSYMHNSMAMFGPQESARFMYPTLPPQTPSRYSVGSGTPQSQGRGMERPYSPRTPEIPSTPSTGSGASMSRLLPSIILIPSLEKRMSRIRIDLMSLQDDIKEWDTKINAIILDNPNFFQDEDYKSLNRKKRRHLQEIKVLEAYNKEMEMALVEDAKEKEKRQSQEEQQVEMLRQRLSQIKNDDPYMAMHQIPPFMYPGGAPPTSSTAYNPYMPQIPVTANQNPHLNPVYQIPPTSRPLHTPSAPTTTSPKDKSKDLPDDIKRMLCLDVNPHAFKSNLNVDEKPLNIPVPKPCGQDVTNPPLFTANQFQTSNDIVRPKSSSNIANIPAVGNENMSSSAIKHRQSEPNLSAKANTPSKFDAQRSQSAANMTMWECEHCTFQNDTSNKACAICYRTSENPKVIGPMGETQMNRDRQDEEPCEFCTYRNKKGTMICEMCARTQTKYAVNEEVAETQGNDGIEQEAELTAGCPNPPGEVGVADTSTVGKLIDEEQDKVYLEKKAAQEKYGKNLDETTSSTPSASAAHVLSPPVRPGPQLPKATSTPANQLAPNRDVQRVRKPSDNDPSSSSTSGSYNSAQTSLENFTTGNKSTSPQKPNEPQRAITPTVKEMEQQGLIKKGRPQLDFAEAIEQISIKRDQEQMSLDAKDFVQIIKEAELAGYDIRETKIAQRQSVQEKVKAIDWLKDKWAKMTDEVARKAGEEGSKTNPNDIGDLSSVEAKEALIQSDGDVIEAVRICVEERAKKYKEISGQGNFVREDILTALYQRDGNIDEARDQLNQAVVQAYLDRLWTEEGEEEREERGDAALISAARAPDRNNSICNSAIDHEEFLHIVKDTQVNRERRMRMVLVEGKLQSWGRADIVITILDTDMNNAETPLECTLADIIEAVRNCGDRKSSLYYLTQQCDVCYALYPMSKIGNLASCDCKLCHECIKQNFEVVIREKYVRNWGCPICSKPDFENNAEAASYFEFLSLVLSTRVSPELMDLFEIKLRDWHLQKDKNFRWCAHCASGFIWDRPDVLGMTCPHCRKKTCFMCKKMWEDQHEGLTCEEYTQWCIDNDPQAQAKGVQVYLEKNGIDCPSCKMRYDLAKGGCMHFKCPQCGHEFCSGCYQPFLKDGLCKMFKSCAKKGLHCHHPRDCFYWLRDYSSPELQKLLKINKVHYNTEPPENQVDRLHCPVMEQKEYDAQKKDEPCNSDTKKGMAGLCESHYKEYLVGLINKNNIDPVTIMSPQEMRILIGRHDREAPDLQPTENEAAYKKRLMQFIKENFKIPKK